MNSEPKTTTLGNIAIKIGISSVVASALFAIGSIGYYGFGLSSEPSALDNIKSGTWSAETKSKLQFTYMYLFFSFYICVISAYFVFNDLLLFKLFSCPLMVIIDFLVQTMVENGKLFARLDSQGVLSQQKLVWISYCAFLGGIASPSFLVGVRTAKISIHITCMIITALIFLSLVAPAGKYITWKHSLSIFEIVVFVASIGAALFPLTTTPGAIFFSTSFYGGLILYPSAFLCHSQESQISASGEDPYCAVGMCVPMLLDTISIFGRIVIMVPPS